MKAFSNSKDFSFLPFKMLNQIYKNSGSNVNAAI